MSIETALATLIAGGLPVAEAPYTGSAKTFVTYHMVNEEDSLFGDGAPIAGNRLISVDFYSPEPWRTVVDNIVAALRTAGYLIQSTGPVITEPERSRRHIPILITEEIYHGED